MYRHQNFILIHTVFYELYIIIIMVASFAALQLLILVLIIFGKYSKHQIIHTLLYHRICQCIHHDTKVGIYQHIQIVYRYTSNFIVCLYHIINSTMNTQGQENLKHRSFPTF